MEERAKKSFNITALKEWEEAGEPFEEDDVILAYLEYKRNEARKNGANPGTSQNLLPPGSLSLGKEEKKERERDEWERRKRKGGIMTIYGVSRGNQKRWINKIAINDNNFNVSYLPYKFEILLRRSQDEFIPKIS
ncbi:hypothetical protein RhiirB3_393034 [Rhizophagus irregularis]|nr:hypothetical protein RhiirB3_393034 [Rhizophagus irregularis]